MRPWLIGNQGNATQPKVALDAKYKYLICWFCLRVLGWLDKSQMFWWLVASLSLAILFPQTYHKQYVQSWPAWRFKLANCQIRKYLDQLNHWGLKGRLSNFRVFLNYTWVEDSKFFIWLIYIIITIISNTINEQCDMVVLSPLDCIRFICSCQRLFPPSIQLETEITPWVSKKI